MSKKMLVAYFTAKWCEPCQYLTPIIKELAKEKETEMDFSIIDVDEEMEISAKIGITEVPTILLVKGDDILDVASGYMPKGTIEQLIEKNKTKA